MSEDRKVIAGKVFLLRAFAQTAKERDAAKKRLKLQYHHVRVFPPRFRGDSYRLFVHGGISMKQMMTGGNVAAKVRRFNGHRYLRRADVLLKDFAKEIAEEYRSHKRDILGEKVKGVRVVKSTRGYAVYVR